DLTRLASGSSTANLPASYIGPTGAENKRRPPPIHLAHCGLMPAFSWARPHARREVRRGPAPARFFAPPGLCMPPDLGPHAPLGYTATAIDRAAERRSDAGFLAALEADQNARAYAIGGELVVLKRNADGLDPLFTLADARALATPAESVFVGLTNGTGRLGVG